MEKKVFLSLRSCSVCLPALVHSSRRRGGQQAPITDRYLFAFIASPPPLVLHDSLWGSPKKQKNISKEEEEEWQMISSLC